MEPFEVKVVVEIRAALREDLDHLEWMGAFAHDRMRVAEKLLRQRGVGAVRLDVEPENRKACRFYEARGYRFLKQVGSWLRLEKRLAA